MKSGEITDILHDFSTQIPCLICNIFCICLCESVGKMCAHDVNMFTHLPYAQTPSDDGKWLVGMNDIKWKQSNYPDTCTQVAVYVWTPCTPLSIEQRYTDTHTHARTHKHAASVSESVHIDDFWSTIAFHTPSSQSSSHESFIASIDERNKSKNIIHIMHVYIMLCRHLPANKKLYLPHATIKHSERQAAFCNVFKCVGHCSYIKDFRDMVHYT